MNRLVKRMRQPKSLVVYLTIGDPSIGETPDLIAACVRGGADVIELGIPFSDPSADGVVIQHAMERALGSGGASPDTIAKSLEIVRTVRRQINIPIVLFGYFNPILQRGLMRVATEAASAGADGFLLVDLPPEESSDFDDALGVNGLVRVPLLAPNTTPDRARVLCKRGGGFAYYVALNGVTGAATLDVAQVAHKIAPLKVAIGDLPLGVGFGVRSAKDVSALNALSEVSAVVVGSALIKAIAEAPDREARIARAESFVRDLKSGIR